MKSKSSDRLLHILCWLGNHDYAPATRVLWKLSIIGSDFPLVDARETRPNKFRFEPL